MNAPTQTLCPILPFRRPPTRASRRAKHATATLRLEGSLAAIIPLAPIIPIFPALNFTASAPCENLKT